jgi:hypothetical protein
MKKKVDLLVAALVEWSAGSNGLVLAEVGAITMDGYQCPWDAPALGRN